MLKLGLLDINATSVNKAYLGSTIVFNGVFTSLWRTTTNNETITLPTPTNYKVNWGDGTITTNTNSHEYATIGNYEIKISGEINDFAFNNLGDKDKILNVSNFKGLRIKEGSFYGSSDLDITATDNPIIDGLFNAFRGCSSLILNDSVNNWDVSNVNDLTNVFFGCVNFNQPLNNWDISNKTNLSGSFRSCTSYNQSLNSWQVQNVSLMNNLFYSCTNYNQPLNNWQVQNVVNFNQIFFGCSNFNQNIDSWQTLSASDVSLMFYNCTNFNQPLNNWVTTSFVYTSFLFFGCTNFNQNINSWDTTNFSTLYRTFRGCANYNHPLNNWNTAKVTDMVECFYSCASFNQPLNNWSFVSVTNMSNFMFGKTANDYNSNYFSDLLIKLDQDLIFANMVNVNLGFGTIKYDSSGVTAYNSLISKGFIIQSGGLLV